MILFDATPISSTRSSSTSSSREMLLFLLAFDPPIGRRSALRDRDRGRVRALVGAAETWGVGTGATAGVGRRRASILASTSLRIWARFQLFSSPDRACSSQTMGAAEFPLYEEASLMTELVEGFASEDEDDEAEALCLGLF